MVKTNLTAQRLRELLHYDPDTGVFTWRTPAPNWPKGASLIAGSKSLTKKSRYFNINIGGRKYGAQRLAWLYMTGEWPKQYIDHIDGNRANNRIANLRDVSHQTNTQNRRVAGANNKCGFLGVHKCGSRWRSEIRHDGAMKHLGVFATPELAHAAFLEAKRELHSGCTI